MRFCAEIRPVSKDVAKAIHTEGAESSHVKISPRHATWWLLTAAPGSGITWELRRFTRASMTEKQRWAEVRQALGSIASSISALGLVLMVLGGMLKWNPLALVASPQFAPPRPSDWSRGSSSAPDTREPWRLSAGTRTLRDLRRNSASKEVGRVHGAATNHAALESPPPQNTWRGRRSSPTCSM